MIIQKMKKYHKTLAILLAITFLSLVKTSSLPAIPINKIPHFDKFVHFTMYFTLGFFLMFEYYLHHKERITRIAKIILLPLFWGASMEIAQRILTPYRAAEWMDMLANTLGVITAYGAVIVLRHNKYIGNFILFPFYREKFTV